RGPAPRFLLAAREGEDAEKQDEGGAPPGTGPEGPGASKRRDEACTAGHVASPLRWKETLNNAKEEVVNQRLRARGQLTPRRAADTAQGDGRTRDPHRRRQRGACLAPRPTLRAS